MIVQDLGIDVLDHDPERLAPPWDLFVPLEVWCDGELNVEQGAGERLEES